MYTDADGNVGLGERVLGTGKDWETEAFKKDVANLPDTASLEEYAAMPVEAFGEAMLRGMGWSEDREVLKVQLLPDNENCMWVLSSL